MGLYDTIYCKASLPLPEDPKDYKGSPSFQTKDLDNRLQEYYIDENNTLFIYKSTYEENGYTKEAKLVPVDVTHTINMYDYIADNNSDYDYFIEYNVVIIKGKIDSATLVNFKPENNLKRKTDEKIFWDNIKLKKKLHRTKRYRFIYIPLSNLIFKFSNGVGKLIQKIVTILNRIQFIIYKIRNKITI